MYNAHWYCNMQCVYIRELGVCVCTLLYRITIKYYVN